MQPVGGVVRGAYRRDELAGFVNCTPGLSDGHPFRHSHMMGVPAYQNGGIGTAPKLAQKNHARHHGIRSIQWGFDPSKRRTRT